MGSVPLENLRTTLLQQCDGSRSEANAAAKTHSESGGFLFLATDSFPLRAHARTPNNHFIKSMWITLRNIYACCAVCVDVSSLCFPFQLRHLKLAYPLFNRRIE